VGALRAAIWALALLTGAHARAGEIDRWQSLIDEASARFGVPAAWIERVMSAESRGRTRLRGRPITSSAGAMGLMQLMPGTWADMRRRLGLGSDPHDPRDNILAGTLYLRLMYDKFGYPGLFGAYNAGPGRYGAYLAGTARLPSETVAYMAATTRRRAGEVIVPAQVSAVNPIFFASAWIPTSAIRQPAAIFVELRGAAGR
jgi:soluble lytic murein transglycosylase-like protein